MDPFITLDELASAVGETIPEEDEFATFCVKAASDVCRTVTEQQLTYADEDVQLLDGTGTDCLRLPERPAVVVEEVSYFSSSTEAWEAIDEAKFGLKNDSLLVRLDRGVWAKGRQNFAVTYSHGYLPEDFPSDVKACALSVASRLFKQGPSPVSSETLGQYSVSYAVESTDLTVNERRILRKFKESL